MELRTGKFHLIGTGAGMFTIWCTDYKLCNRLNKILTWYVGYKFMPGEEGRFVFHVKDAGKVKAALQIQTDIA